MEASFYDRNNNYLGKINHIYNYLNIDITKSSDEVNDDNLRIKLGSLKMHNGTITTDDKGKIQANKIYKVELRDINSNIINTFYI